MAFQIPALAQQQPALTFDPSKIQINQFSDMPVDPSTTVYDPSSDSWVSVSQFPEKQTTPGYAQAFNDLMAQTGGNDFMNSGWNHMSQLFQQPGFYQKFLQAYPNTPSDYIPSLLQSGYIQSHGLNNGYGSFADIAPMVFAIAGGALAGAAGGGTAAEGAGASYGGAGDFASATGPSISASDGLSGGALTQSSQPLGSGLSTQAMGEGLRVPTYPTQAGMGAQGIVVPSGSTLGDASSFINAPGVLAAAPSDLVGGSGFVPTGTTPALGDPSSFINRGAFNAMPASSSSPFSAKKAVDLARLGIGALPSGGGMLGGGASAPQQQSPASLFVPVMPGVLQPFIGR